jgi:hypothetical protein
LTASTVHCEGAKRLWQSVFRQDMFHDLFHRDPPEAVGCGGQIAASAEPPRNDS